MTPDELLEATAKAICDDANFDGAWDIHSSLDHEGRKFYRKHARAAISLALEAAAAHIERDAHLMDMEMRSYAKNFAAAIRALKPKD